MAEGSFAAEGSLRGRLPRLSTAEAEARNRLLAALNGLRIDGILPRAGVRAAPPASAWLEFTAGPGQLWLAGEIVAGQPVSPRAPGPIPDLPEFLVEMSRLEPLIAALERACGFPLGPSSATPPRPAALTFHLSLADAGGAIVHAAWIAVSKDLVAGWPRAAPRCGRLGPAARASIACRLALAGPAAPRCELRLLQAGDVVVLPGAPGARRPARLAAGRRTVVGAYDLISRLFLATTTETDMPDLEPPPGALADDDTASAPTADSVAFADIAEAQVRLQVLLPALRLTVGALAALAPGSVAVLPVDGQDLKVELLADGARIASGRLVALDEAYGVLIDQVAPN